MFCSEKRPNLEPYFDLTLIMTLCRITVGEP
jgi:hypothetical protein